MNRRNFFKVVTGFVAGIFATSAKADVTVFPTSDSEWAKQKPLYVPKSGPPGPTEIPAIWSVWYPDDTKAIQEAINLAKNGGVVYFPKGTYNLRYAIEI